MVLSIGKENTLFISSKHNYTSQTIFIPTSLVVIDQNELEEVENANCWAFLFTVNFRGKSCSCETMSLLNFHFHAEYTNISQLLQKKAARLILDGDPLSPGREMLKS